MGASCAGARGVDWGVSPQITGPWIHQKRTSVWVKQHCEDWPEFPGQEAREIDADSLTELCVLLKRHRGVD